MSSTPGFQFGAAPSLAFSEPTVFFKRPAPPAPVAVEGFKMAPRQTASVVASTAPIQHGPDNLYVAPMYVDTALRVLPEKPSSAAKPGHVVSHSASSSVSEQTNPDQHEEHDTTMLDRDDHDQDASAPSEQSRTPPPDVMQSTEPSDLMLAPANAKQPSSVDAAIVQTPTTAADVSNALEHTTNINNHTDVKRHGQVHAHSGKAVTSKATKSNAKAKPAKVPGAPTSFKADQLLGLYQHTLFAERAHELEALKATIVTHNHTISQLRELNEGLGEERDESVAVLNKFAHYMKRLDTDFPAIQNTGKKIDAEVKSLSQSGNDISREISESQAEIERIRAKYQAIVKTLGDDVRSAIAQNEDLRAQLNKSELNLSEERFRSLGLGKQLEQVAGAKTDMLGKLGQLQVQFGSIESLLQKKADTESSGIAKAIDGILIGVTANTTSEEMKSSLKHLEDTVRQLHER